MYCKNPMDRCNYEDIEGMDKDNLPVELRGYIEINNQIADEGGDEIMISVCGKDVVVDEHNKPILDKNGEMQFEESDAQGIWMTPEEIFDLGKTLLFVASVAGFNESDKTDMSDV
jgi:hypothetical protein